MTLPVLRMAHTPTGASRVDDRAFADECSLGKFGMAADDGGRVGKHRKLKTQRLELLIEGAPPRGAPMLPSVTAA